MDSLIQKQGELMSQDAKAINEYHVKLDQAKRNSEQGLIGRSLAEDKIAQIKSSMEGIKKNMATEMKYVQDQIEYDQKRKEQNTDREERQLKDAQKHE